MLSLEIRKRKTRLSGTVVALRRKSPLIHIYFEGFQWSEKTGCFWLVSSSHGCLCLRYMVHNRVVGDFSDDSGKSAIWNGEFFHHDLSSRLDPLRLNGINWLAMKLWCVGSAPYEWHLRKRSSVIKKSHVGSFLDGTWEDKIPVSPQEDPIWMDPPILGAPHEKFCTFFTVRVGQVLDLVPQVYSCFRAANVPKYHRRKYHHTCLDHSKYHSWRWKCAQKILSKRNGRAFLSKGFLYKGMHTCECEVWIGYSLLKRVFDIFGPLPK